MRHFRGAWQSLNHLNSAKKIWISIEKWILDALISFVNSEHKKKLWTAALSDLIFLRSKGLFKVYCYTL